MKPTKVENCDGIFEIYCAELNVLYRCRTRLIDGISYNLMTHDSMLTGKETENKDHACSITHVRSAVGYVLTLTTLLPL